MSEAYEARRIELVIGAHNCREGRDEVAMAVGLDEVVVAVEALVPRLDLVVHYLEPVLLCLAVAEE